MGITKTERKRMPPWKTGLTKMVWTVSTYNFSIFSFYFKFLPNLCYVAFCNECANLWKNLAQMFTCY
jgi:hypothetical protein